MNRNILYIINPVAGTKPKKSLEKIITEKTKKQNIPFKILPSVSNGNYSFLHKIILQENITDVVIAGGDGTVNQVVGSLLDFNLNFGIIPCGSGNGLAYTAKIPKQATAALDIIFNGKSSAVDGFYINNKFACMLAGLGFDAKVANEFAKQPHRGLKTYALLVSKNFFSAKPYQFLINSNGIEFSTEAFFISIANSNQFGNNFTIAPQAILSDGLLDIVIVKKTAKPLLLFNLIKQILAGRLRKIENSLKLPVIYFQTKKIFIINKNKAPIHIDGEPAETAKEFKIEIRKKCFKLIQP